MAGYTRQATFTTGNVVSASDFNNEFDELLSAFSNTSGHSHDGTAAEGPVIGLIGDAGNATPLNKIVVDTSNNRVGVFVNVSSAAVEQVRIQDGAIVPVTDSDVDLGTSSLRFKDLHIDSIAMATTTVTDILDEDNMASNSATALATQQSIKAYVDASSGGGGGGGSSTFVGLTDTPSSLSSDGGKMVKVNSGGTALEFVTANTDAIAEGSSNQYHTTARARAAVSVATATASGNGGLTYNDSTGVFTFTPADVSSGGGSSTSLAWAVADSSVSTSPTVTGTVAIGLGYNTQATASYAIAIGHDARATGNYTISAGGGTRASSEYGIALGYSAIADQNYSVAIGYGANTSATNELMLGSTIQAYGFDSIRVGNSSYVPSNSMDLTTKSYVDSQITTNVASSFPFIASNGTATAGGTDDIAIGPGSNTNSNDDAIAIGKGAEVNGYAGVAIGRATESYGAGVAVGSGAASLGSGVAIGSATNSQQGIAIGNGAAVGSSHLYSVALGKAAATTTSRELMLGAASSNGFTSVRVGNTSYVPSNNLDLTPKNYVDTQVATKAALSDLSVTTASASGGGALAYNSSTGAFTFTPATSGNRTFVRYTSYAPNYVAPFNFDSEWSSATYSSSRFMTNQTTITKADNSGLGITVNTPTAGVEESPYIGGGGTSVSSSSKVIKLTNNTGSNISLTTNGQYQLKYKLRNSTVSSSSIAPSFQTSAYVGGSQWCLGGNMGGNSSGAVNRQLFANAASTTYTTTVTPISNRTWTNGTDINIEFIADTYFGSPATLSAIVGYDIDFDIVEITVMYDSAVSTYNSTTTDTEGVRLTFAPSSTSSGYGTLNSSPQTGDHLVGFYEGSSASTTPTDYDWSIYAPVPSSALAQGDILRYSTSNGWEYESLDLSPTSFSKFAAGTLTHSNASSYETVGTLMKLSDGFTGVGEVIVSVKTSAGVEVQKVNFLLTSSGVSHTTFATVSSTGSTLGTLDVVFSSANGGTALLKSQNASAVATTYTFHVTQL